MQISPLNALAEVNRMRIVELLRDGPRPVGEITGRLRLRQPQVSKHLRILREAGIVKVLPVAQKRVYQLQAQPFKDLGSWLETFRRLWESRLDTLDEYLQDMKGDSKRG